MSRTDWILRITRTDSLYRARERVMTIVSYTTLSLFAAAFLVPIVWMLATALKPDVEQISFPPTLIGSRIQWENLTRAWTAMPFNRFIVNSIFVSGGVTIVTVVGSSMAAYAFSRIEFRGRDTIFLLYIATLMIPVHVTIVPLFIIIRDLGWIDTYRALILPVSFTAFGTFLMRQFFLTVPYELEDSGRMDGASRFILFTRIMLPLVKPALATLAIFTFVTQWKNFLWPLIVVNRTRMMTIPLGLDRFQGQFGTAWNLMMSAAAIGVIPSILFFLFFQKYLAKGIVLSGLGGR